MKPSVSLLASASLLLTSHAAWAAELYLNTFLGANPLKDLEVELDGKVLGSTDERGSIIGQIDKGTHHIRVLERGVPLAEHQFEVQSGESADVSISFETFDQPPEITVDAYDPAQTTIGDPGMLQGYVQAADATPIAGATVRLDPLGVTSVSDETGYFRIEAPRGSYSLIASHPDYQPASIENFRIVANVGLAANITLTPPAAATAEAAEPAADDVAEIVVVGTYKPAAATTVAIERFSTAVTDAISVEDLIRSGDSSVAASLRRVVGVSITGGKYAVVRGLDGRYIASTLNGNLMPSTDPFRRDVELDLFPADILGGIEIQKSYSADLPGDTTGGIIKIKTRDLPDGYVNSLSGSIGYVTGVTGDDILTYEGSDTDSLGYDDGLRDLPGAVYSATNGGRNFSVCQIEGQANCVSPERAAELASMLPNIYNTQTKSAGLPFDLSYTLGNVFDRDFGTIGLYGTVSYETSTKSRQDAFIDIINVRRADYARDEIDTTINGYFVAGIQNDAGWEILSKTILLRDTEDTTELEEGVDFEQNQAYQQVLLEWVERQFLGQQFEGSWSLPHDSKLEWRAGISQTSRESPDRRSYEYRAAETEDGSFGPLQLITNTVDRSYADLTEDGLDLGIDYTLPFDLAEAIRMDFKVGALFNQRERESELVRISFSGGSNVDRSQDVESLLTPENFASGEFRLAGDTLGTDAYNADQDALAVYLNTTTNFGEAVTLVAGLRQDNFEQSIEFPFSTQTPVDIQSEELLPALALIYRPAEKWQLRGGYSLTVSRPNITENAPTRFFDERGREYIGCTANGAPACVPSMIDNYDLRAEYYFDGERDSISLAFFYKDIDDPIERAISGGSGSAANALTFRNNESATVSGIELDANWVAFEGSDHLLSVGGNLAFIESEIKLGPLGRQFETDPDRDLQGQSPFLANFQIAYDHLPTTQKLTLLVNYFDDRIDSAARAPQTPITELGRAVLNLNYEKEFANRSKLSFKVRNLLDDEIQYEQNGRVIESYKEGTAFSLGYSYKFGG